MANDRNLVNIISVDIGTTHVKAVLYQENKGILGLESESYPTYYPKANFVEQNPEEIFLAVLNVLHRLMTRSIIPAKDVTALVFAGIAQSLIPVDRDGKALCHAFNWADKRSIPQNEKLRTRINVEEVRSKTGCTLHPMYYPSRLLWLKEITPEIFTCSDRFITIKEYVLERLFGVKQIDYSVASSSGIWNMHTKSWDSDLLSEIGVSRNALSETVETSTLLGRGLKKDYATMTGLTTGTPGVIGAYDGALAHLGTLGLENDGLSLTVGTGAALRKRITSPKILPGTEAWCYYMTDDNWLLGGVLHDSGNVIKWFVDQFLPASDDLDQRFQMLESLVRSVPAGSDGLMFIPHLGGERCPHDSPDSKGMVYGLTFNHTQGHLARSLMEGLSYNLFSVYRMLSPDLNAKLVVSGGILNSPAWLGIVADFFNQWIWLPRIKESTAWGGVMLAMKAMHVVDSYDTFDSMISPVEKQEPDAENMVIYRKLLTDLDQLYEYKNSFEQKIKKEN